MLDIIKKWAGWIVALIIAAFAFLDENPIPKSDPAPQDSVISVLYIANDSADKA